MTARLLCFFLRKADGDDSSGNNSSASDALEEKVFNAEHWKSLSNQSNWGKVRDPAKKAMGVWLNQSGKLLCSMGVSF